MAGSTSYILIKEEPLDADASPVPRGCANPEGIISRGATGAPREQPSECKNVEPRGSTFIPQSSPSLNQPTTNSSNAEEELIPRVSSRLVEVKLEFSTAPVLRTHEELHQTHTEGSDPPPRNTNDASASNPSKVKQRPFKCDACSATFLLSCHLKAHANIHIGKAVFACDLCSASFTRRYCLTRHLRTYPDGLCKRRTTDIPPRSNVVDGDERPYRCDVCPARFQRARQLKRHAQQHTDVRPHKCEYCPAAFLKQSTLKCHVRIHTGEKPYECQLCPAEFAESGKLSRHMRTHTGTKPYKCTLCPAAFSQSSNLKNHVKKHGQAAASDLHAPTITLPATVRCHVHEPGDTRCTRGHCPVSFRHVAKSELPHISVNWTEVLPPSDVVS